VPSARMLAWRRRALYGRLPLRDDFDRVRDDFDPRGIRLQL